MQVEIVEQSEYTSYPSSLGTGRIQLKNILVPTDFSSVSVKALAYGVALARQFNANLSLLHVIVPMPPYTGAETIPIVVDDTQLTAEAEQRLTELAARHVPSDVAVTALVRQGSTEREIADFAKANDVDLVIASTHNHKGLNRALFGGVTEHIVHKAPCPILIVREHEHEFLADGAHGIRIRRILAPVDFSDCSKKALRYAMAFAGQFNAEIFCLHVRKPERPKIIFETEAYEKSQALETEQKFAALMREVDGVVPLQSKIVSGIPEKEIVACADQRDVDLIVLGEHCRTGVFGRFMMGSTTDEVVKQAHCPILVVRPNEHEFVS